MKFNFSEEQEQKFNELVIAKRDLMIRALFKVHLPLKYFDEFYNFTLEGLAVAFLILENGDINEEDFDRFAFSTMKRKVIDELRRRNKEDIAFLDSYDNIKSFSECDSNIVDFEFFSSIEKYLDSIELAFFKDLLITKNPTLTIKRLNLSKSSGYRIYGNIKKISKEILLHR